MRTILPLLVLLTLATACLLSCSSDDPTEPGPPPPEDTILDQATIGSGGGTLDGDGIEVNVPAGALDDDATLALVHEATTSLGGATASVRLEGLPADFAAPIGIRIAAPDDGTTGGEPAVYALVSAIPAVEDTSLHLATLPATLSGDTLVAALPPGDYVLMRDDAGKDVGDLILDLILTGTRTQGRSSTQIPLPIYVDGDERILFYRDLLLQWLVEDAGRFMPLTDNFRQTAYPDRPPTVAVLEGTVTYNESRFSRIRCHPQTDSETTPLALHILFEYSPEAGTDLDELRRQLNFTLWDQIYSARTGLPVDWWLYATLYTLQLDVIDSISPFFEQYRPLSLRGVRRVVEQEPDPYTAGLAPYGYGMIDLALWIDRHQGDGWGREALGATINERAGYTYTDVKHLDDALPGGAATWWPAFIADQMQGNIRPLDTTLFEPRIEETWTVEESYHQSHTFSGEQICLDANIYRIALERDDFGADDQLRLTVTDPRDATTLVVFAADDTGWQEIARGATVTVEHLDQLAALDEDIMVLTANWDLEDDEDSRRTIEVSALISDGTPPPDIRTFDELHIEVCTDNTYSDGVYHPNQILHVIVDMAWNGSGFFVMNDDDTLSVAVDPATLTLGGWYAASRFGTIGGNTFFVRAAGSSVPVSGWGTDDWGTQHVSWSVYGDDEVCGRLSALYREEWWGDDLARWLVGHECHETDALYDTSHLSIMALKRAK